MDRFELVVDQRKAHQERRKSGVLFDRGCAVLPDVRLEMEILLKKGERFVHLLDWRWHKPSLMDGSTFSTYPVLAVTKMARSVATAAHTPEQNLVQLTNQP